MKHLISMALAFVVCLAATSCSATPTPVVDYYDVCGTQIPIFLEQSQIVPSQSAPIPPRGNQAQIAFVSDRSGDQHIYLMNADGSGLTDLTNYPGDHGYPVWSPDGNNLVYLRDGNVGIELKNADGSQFALPDGIQPAWSPDGKHIAFVTNRRKYAPNYATPLSPLSVDLSTAIYLMNADGSNQTPLGLGDAITSSGDLAGWSGDAPAWSPDGQYIAYVVFSDGLFIMTSDGSRTTRLGTGDVYPTVPVWSPDGRKIAYSNSDGIYVIDADGSHRVLLNSGKWDNSPAWSPDGKQIAFWSARDGNNQIYVMNADGSGVTRLTKDTANDIAPTWSPDGSMIAYHSDTGCLEQVCIMTTAGRVETCTRGAGRDSEAGYHTAWRPNHSP